MSDTELMRRVMVGMDFGINKEIDLHIGKTNVIYISFASAGTATNSNETRLRIRRYLMNKIAQNIRADVSKFTDNKLAEIRDKLKNMFTVPGTDVSEDDTFVICDSRYFRVVVHINERSAFGNLHLVKPKDFNYRFPSLIDSFIISRLKKACTVKIVGEPTDYNIQLTRFYTPYPAQYYSDNGKYSTMHGMDPKMYIAHKLIKEDFFSDIDRNISKINKQTTLNRGNYTPSNTVRARNHDRIDRERIEQFEQRLRNERNAEADNGILLTGAMLAEIDRMVEMDRSESLSDVVHRHTCASVTMDRVDRDDDTNSRNDCHTTDSDRNDYSYDSGSSTNCD